MVNQNMKFPTELKKQTAETLFQTYRVVMNEIETINVAIPNCNDPDFKKIYVERISELTYKLSNIRREIDNLEEY